MPEFLAEDWFDAAEAAAGEMSFDTGVAAVLNLTVTGAPAGEVAAHIDTTTGLAMARGHADGASATVTMPLDVCRRMFIDGDAGAAMTAFMAGQLKVQGDMTKVLGLQGVISKPEAVALREKIAAVTD